MAVHAPTQSQPLPAPRALAPRALALLGGAVALLVVALLSLRIGAQNVSTDEVWRAFFEYDATSYNQTIVRSLRLPRTLIAIAVGGGLAVAGAVMQSVTRNPLAGPSILGVSSGASFAVVTAIYLGGLTSPYSYVWFSFGGGAVASAMVFLIGSAGRGGATPVKLALAGAVVTALLNAWITALLLLDERTLDIARFWLAGSVAGRGLNILWVVSPFLVVGVAACLQMANQFNVLNLGEDTARALGMNTARVRLISAALVVVITGAAVSAAGPIGFVGLAAPHMVRALTGPDNRWVLPGSLLLGAILLLGADILGRVLVRPAELQAGIVTAMLGAPVLIYLARRRSVAN